MFFTRMVARSFSRQLRKRLLIALTVGLSAAVSVAMLGVVFDVGDKLTAELTTYGSNIVVQPKANAVVTDLYGAGGGGTDNGNNGAASSQDPTAFLNESDASNIKTIFWAYNITNFAPELTIHASVNGTDTPLVGTWFNKTLHLASGETTVVGVQDGMRSWWKTSGRWPKDGAAEGMIGSKAAARLGVRTGDTITLGKNGRAQAITIVGQYTSGDNDDNAIYTPTTVTQALAGQPDSVNKIEVKALTTPDNDLARKAAKNPAALSQDEWETWYCTAYPSSIAYQIEEALPGAVAKQVRQVAALQGNVLNKTRAVMILMTALTLIAAAVAVANLMAASITERSSELALLKALGATDSKVSRLMLAETATVSLAGALVGGAVGSGLAQIIGHVVFGSSITMRPMVYLLVFVLLAVVVCVASLSSIRSILSVHPAEVLHGR